MGRLIGQGSSGFLKIAKKSGARIFHTYKHGVKEQTITLTGTEGEIQMARNLLQERLTQHSNAIK